MSDTSILQPPAQAAANPPADGAQPPLGQTAQAAQADIAFAREENARTVLRGEAGESESAEQTRRAGIERQQEIDAQFDPETGELLDEDPLSRPESGDRRPERDSAGEAPGEDAGEELWESGIEENQDAAADKDPESETGAEDEAEKGRGKRIRIRRDSLSDRDFAILTLAKEKRVSFADAERQLFGSNESEPAADAAHGGKVEQASCLLPAASEEAAASPSGANAAPTSARISEQIAALRAERDAATEANDGRQVNRLNDRLADLRDTLYEARQAEAAQRAAAQEKARMRYATVETGAIHRAAELFPDAQVAGSELNEVMKAKAASLRKQDPAYFENPRWPILLTVETAATLGISPKGKPAPAQEAAPAAPVPPRKATRPAPAPAPGSATSASQLNSESALRAELKAATASRDVDGIKLVMRKIQQSARE